MLETIFRILSILGGVVALGSIFIRIRAFNKESHKLVKRSNFFAFVSFLMILPEIIRAL